MTPPYKVYTKDGSCYAAIKSGMAWYAADGTGWVSHRPFHPEEIDYVTHFRDWGTPVIERPEVMEAQAETTARMRNALGKQVGGQHYKDKAIQPVQYIHANKIGYFEGNVIKYVTRWRDKNGLADLEKAKHYIELLIELEKANAHQQKEKMSGAPAA